MLCLGCKSVELPDWRTGSRLCPDCAEEGHEDNARRCDPTYDRQAMNPWERLVQAVARAYGWVALCKEKWKPSEPPVRRRAVCQFCEKQEMLVPIRVRGFTVFGEGIEYERMVCGPCWNGIHGEVEAPRKWWRK